MTTDFEDEGGGLVLAFGETSGGVRVPLLVDSDGNLLAVLETSDIQIGAVEIKDGDSDVRLDVEQVTAKNAVYTRSEDGAHPTVGTTTDAAASSSVAEDATARTGIGLWKGVKNVLLLINAKLAALGQAAMAASMPVAIASDQSAVPVDVPTATPTVFNVTLASADTEYSQAMPANCRGFEFQARTSAAIRFAFETGKVAAPTEPYMT